ncbi:GlsB/YeaQ/YmgE family stress response membrane protein [Pseudoflavitalea sp. G-6-1-2]|uniref:GlsB/YeaQ/YmgE family stress response membrane protein n=1 Tax=Pseudoflavitalea sp. G-6-1-2 TaxID=2728841 RepID=UPI00146CE603|nr:GlsB/YeaQ/YmgE family stress response membrane protein [Pseudoflavitalea sp. G-6-1-2]NML22495.1 GlsB/YeaQ/YmgE family stress response membrane protein [Pseudoflavitalea sp. G-6-1-2]
MHFLWFILIGAIAGWLAGLITKGGGFGLLGNIVIGIVGAVIGGWLARTLNISVGGGTFGSLLVATGGAVVLLVLIGMLRGSR